jgi:hypothetical protein
MAEKLGLKWPPPPTISVRNLIRLTGMSVAFRPDVVEEPWATLLCKFSDDLSEPFPMNFYQDLFTLSGVGTHNMVDFYTDISQRKLDVSGSQVFGWFTLSQKKSDYKGSGANPQGRTDLVNWAKEAASDKGVNLDPFSVVVVILNVPTDLFGSDGYAVSDLNSMCPSLLGQEVGHGYGLSHSRDENKPGVDYQDSWDVMSTANAYEEPNAKYKNIGPFLNACNMEGRGWLNESRVASAFGPAGQTVALRPLARPDLPGWLAARVGIYLVEFRVQESWDAAIPRPAVLVHRFAGNQSYIQHSAGGDGHQDMVEGDVFEVGNPAHPGWAKVKVLHIDPEGYIATIQAFSNP